MRAFLAALTAVVLATGVAHAQEDRDVGLLQGFIEDRLSGGGRQIRIEGFEGALSSRATIDELTIADEEGTWFTLRNAVLDWNRSALLRGRFTVTELSAEELIVERRPITEPQVDVPSAQASGFSLPELPVSVNIGEVSIERAVLGEDIIGQEAVLSLEGSASLADGSGEADLTLQRLDGPEGQIALDAAFDGQSEVLSLDLRVDEAADGLAVNLLNIPGAPSLELTVQGEGPLDDFTAEIALDTDGEPRVTGTVALDGTDDGGRAFDVEIGGDITQIVQPDYEDFLGSNIALILRGRQTGDGRTVIEELGISALSLTLEGSAAIGADGLPDAFDLEGALRSSDGGSVTLPFGGGDTSVDRAQITANFDGSVSDRWTLDLIAQGIDQPQIEIATLRLGGGGTIAAPRAEGGERAVTADLTFTAGGIDPADEALAEAVGEDIRGDVNLTWADGEPLELTSLNVIGTNYSAAIEGIARIQNRSVLFEGDAALNADDLSRFSGVAGRPLTGDVEATLSGNVDALGGIFDAELSLQGTDLSIGQETADELLDGPVSIDLSAARDTGGTTLRAFSIDSPAITASGEGRLGPTDSDLVLTARLADLGVIVEDYSGPVTLEGRVQNSAPEVYEVSVDLAAPYDLTARIDGRIAEGTSDVDLAVSLPDIAPYLPDTDYSGPLDVTGNVAETGEGRWRVDVEGSGPYQSSFDISGPVGDGRSDIEGTISLPDVAPLAPGADISGPIRVTGSAVQNDEGLFVVDVEGSGPYESTFDLEGPVGSGRTALEGRVAIPEIAPLLPETMDYEGAVEVTGSFRQSPDGRIVVDVDGAGPYGSTFAVEGPVGGGETALEGAVAIPDIQPLVPGGTYSGPLNVTGTAEQGADGRFTLDVEGTGPYDSVFSVEGPVGGGETSIAFDAALPDIAPLAPGDYSGPLSVSGTAAQTGEGRFAIDVNGSGPYDSTFAVEGPVGDGRSEVSLALNLPSLSPIASGIPGGLSVTGDVAENGDGRFRVDLDASGPYGATASVEGLAGATGTDVDVRVSVPNVGAIAPGINGPLTLTSSVEQVEDTQRYRIDADFSGPYSTSGTVAGVVGAEDSDVDLAVSIPNIAPLAPGLSGSVRVAGNLQQSQSGYAVDLDVTGPGPARASVDGTIAPDFGSAALDATGSIPLGLANAALDPNQIVGTASFDLGLNGPLELASVAGTVSTNGARFFLPNLSQAITDINATVNLGSGTARINASARGGDGGRLSANGTLGLGAGLPADIAVTIRNYVLRDPELYETRVSGDLQLSGPLAGRGGISGRLNLGETEIRVPDSGLGFGGDIPEITHINEPGPVYITRLRADLAGPNADTDGDDASGGGSGGLNLDIRIVADNQIFVRGRGLEAELGGELTLGGTTSDIVPVGRFELIRGRLDILGERIVLDQGAITLQGDFVPYVALSASTETDEYTITIRVEGPVDDPEITFSSTPSLPQEEVLAQFLFGRDVTQLSPLQAAQLANAVATLTGRGGVGIVGQIRENLGLDDLDFTTDETGGTELRIGKYLSDNVYTDVTTGSDGDTEINLNIDVRRNVTVKGSAGSDGETSLGIFFERDY
ncbi:translocation/assembly module TamB domain-containing protein [Roseicyclus sp. F158]|uniref:Translocation/assembly module TamB domain-containing protein n=1 Tax=Tropicimonas omnivorans TaxID=3075590 RepID=A0ABU3DDS3_9RHOB|nr:translocation/assembly module TamB domain-containing protein [Roseicyclus sp. F158]MDT0681875.1 translocation/assembly module TamB domain-containing protein [Roseicyclus sp. F158]